MTSKQWIDPFKSGEAYSVAETARLAKTTPQTVRRWLVGYDRPGHHMEPVFGSKPRDPRTNLRVSFLELVEIAVAVGWRDLDVKLERIRQAHEFASQKLGVPYPFATMDFQPLGGHIIHEFEVEVPERQSGHMAFDSDGQWTLPGFVTEILHSIEYDRDDKVASRWFPYGRVAAVVIDPHLAAGRPVVAGTRVPVSAIQERFEAGDSVRYLARDFGLTVSVVEEVIRLAHAA